jgi:arginine/serine-rich splicing factor 4/5/6
MASRVYMGGISYRARERDIEHFFGKFGKIREISLKSGFCFIDFDDYRDADDAVYELNGKSFMGTK